MSDLRQEMLRFFGMLNKLDFPGFHQNTLRQVYSWHLRTPEVHENHELLHTWGVPHWHWDIPSESQCSS